MIKNLSIACFLFYIPFIYSQDNKIYKSLSKFTFGVHSTNYENATSKSENSEYKSTLEDIPQYGLFLDYRFLDYKNNSLKIGAFINWYKYASKYSGVVFDPISQQDLLISSDPRPNFIYDKQRKIELYLDYGYMIKINKNVFVNLSLGYSYEFSKPSDFTDTTYTVSDFINNNVPDYLVYYDISIVNDTRSQIHFNPTVSYKTNLGLINLGIKYSLPVKNNLNNGNFKFIDRDFDNTETIYKGTFKQSGKYLSFTLSFTPSKNLFKKKK